MKPAGSVSREALSVSSRRLCSVTIFRGLMLFCLWLWSDVPRVGFIPLFFTYSLVLCLG